MTTFLYTTDSNSAEVTDGGAVNALVDGTEYWFTVEPDVTVRTDGTGTIGFSTVDDPNGAFDVHPEPDTCTSVAEEFFTELTEYLTETLTVKCIETQGYGDPAVWKWVVEPDGTVTLHNF